MSTYDGAYTNTVEDCLAGSLTLLHYTGTIHFEESAIVIANSGYEGLFNLLNEKYKEMTDKKSHIINDTKKEGE